MARVSVGEQYLVNVCRPCYPENHRSSGYCPYPPVGSGWSADVRVLLVAALNARYVEETASAQVSVLGMGLSGKVFAVAQQAALWQKGGSVLAAK